MRGNQIDSSLAVVCGVGKWRFAHCIKMNASGGTDRTKIVYKSSPSFCSKLFRAV